MHNFILIVHDIYKAFDANHSLEIRGIFLDISKAFDRLRLKCLLYEVKCNGIDRNSFELVENVLSKRYQRVVLMAEHVYGLSRCTTRINSSSFIFSYLHQFTLL